MTDPTDIFQAIFDSISHLLEPDWDALCIEYRVDETRSSFVGSYVTRAPAGLEEVSIAMPDGLDEVFRELRQNLLGGNRQRFSGCKFQISRDGAFDAKYSYDDIDWDQLLIPTWNFPNAVIKRVAAY
jgi:hypothetical protein